MKEKNILIFPQSSSLSRLKKIMAEALPAVTKTTNDTLFLQQLLDCALRIETLLKKYIGLIFQGSKLYQHLAYHCL